jgi:hypothetical protein
MRIERAWVYGLLWAAFLSFATAALAGEHTWDVNEVFSDASGNIQFVELWEANGTPGETAVDGNTMSSNTKSFVISGPSLVAPTTNKFFLMATPGFAALAGAPTPDRIIPAGSVPFFATGGDTIMYQPWDSWTFGAVPTDGVNSLDRISGVGANSPTNYAGVTGSVNANVLATPAVPSLPGWGLIAVGTSLLLAGLLVARARTRAS